MRTRISNWIDMKTRKPAFGFQVYHDGRWMNAAEDGKPCIYTSEAKRDKKQAEFRKLKSPYNAAVTGGGALD